MSTETTAAFGSLRTGNFVSLRIGSCAPLRSAAFGYLRQNTLSVASNAVVLEPAMPVVLTLS